MSGQDDHRTANTTWKPVGPPDASDVWVGHAVSDRFNVYTRGNAGEVYPEVFTPLSFSVAAEAGERAMRAAILNSGLIRRRELDEVPITTAVGSGVFGGYAYLNLSIQRLASARMPGGKATDADVNYLGVGEPPPYTPDPKERNLLASIAGLRYVWRTAKVTELPELEQDRARVDAFVASLPPVGPETSERELRESVRDIMPLFEHLFEHHLTISFAAGIMVATLNGICERRLDDPLLATSLLAGLGDVDSAAPSAAMWELSRSVVADPGLTAMFDAGVADLDHRLRAAARDGDKAAAPFVAGFDTFLERFGSRGPNEWDTAFDTWGTDHALALTLIDRLRGASPDHDPAAQQQRLAAEAAEAEAEALGRLKGLDRMLFRRSLASARLHSRARERTKTTVIRAIHGARVRAMELDHRLAERAGGTRGDLWYLLDEEVDGYLDDPAGHRALIEDRRAQHARLSERIPPFFFAAAQPPLEEWERRDAELDQVEQGQVLSGLPGCPGTATGRARVVTHPSDPQGLSAGDVLVAPLTDPSWTPLFLAAEAVVVDVGAVMSHAVIVSRELGIPCVVSATDASRRIPDGALIEVDGTAGTVTILDEGGSADPS
ncbi:MAG: PEP-utilizing enzyme [Actinomycetota bacterium]